MQSVINPFYANRRIRLSTSLPSPSTDPVYVRLPRAPVNTSPVPHLTSLYHFSRAGEYGDRSYPGNCGGNLIKDLLRYFQPSLVCDPMAGSGTCQDVCVELRIPCMAWDIHQGFDACDPTDFSARDTFDFIWAHPAYWRQKLYADDPRDLSRAPTLDDFLRRYGQFIRNAARALKPGGKLAILMGDYCDREVGFVPLSKSMILRQIYADAPGQGAVVWQMGARARDAAQEVDDLFREILPNVAKKRLTARRQPTAKQGVKHG